jgi:hypothetical protein
MNFAVFLMGENFLLPGHTSLQGFFVTKGLSAQNEQVAAAQAVAAVKADLTLADSFSLSKATSPTLTVKVVHQLPHVMKDTEYFFFPMEDA